MPDSPAPVDPESLLLVGRIGRSHGVRGDVKVAPESDDPSRLAGVPRLFAGETPAATRELRLRGVRFQYPRGRVVVLAAFEGVETVEATEDLRGLNLYALEADLPPLAPGEAYLHDLAGLAVYLAGEDGEPAGEPLGTVRDVYDGAQLLFAIARPGRPDVLLPDVEEFVVRLDLEARRLVVRPPEGLFDDADAAVVPGDAE